MITTIDKAGRIIVPKEFRDELKFSPQSQVEILCDGKEVVIRKLESPKVSVHKKSGFLILDFEGNFEDANQLKKLREERILQFL